MEYKTQFSELKVKYNKFDRQIMLRKDKIIHSIENIILNELIHESISKFTIILLVKPSRLCTQ